MERNQAIFLGLVVTALLGRLVLVLVLTMPGYLGVDGGAYLMSVNAVLGDEPTGIAFTRPPLAPGWLMVPFTELWGPDIGYKIWSAVASVPILVPVYLLARRFISPVAALWAVAFLTVDPLQAEMLITGSLPLLAFTFLGLAWWAMGGLAERPSLRLTAVLASSIAIIPFINQTTAGLAAITLPIYLAGMLWFSPRRRTRIWRNILPGAIAGSILALGALPWYAEVMFNSKYVNYPGPLIYIVRVEMGWVLMALGVSLGAALIHWARDYRLRSLGVLAIVLGVFSIFLSYNETVINIFYRSRYLLAIPFYIGVAWLVHYFWDINRRFLIGGSALAFGLMLYGYAWQAHNQQGYSQMITPSSAVALSHVPERIPLIVNNYSMAWWVAGLNKSVSYFVFNTTPPKLYEESDAEVRCLLGWVPECDHKAAKAALKTEYVLVDTRFPYYNDRAPGIYGAPEDMWGVTTRAPWLELIFSRDSTLLWHIR